MTDKDRELLELAAKAAGLMLWTHANDDGFYISDPMRRWNPLDNDGDALRLAIKTKVLFDMQDHVGQLIFEEGIQSDSEAEARRAITRAAAEIGKAMT